MTSRMRVAIVGAGPGGLMLARLLELQGFTPTVYERDRHAHERPQGGSLDLHSETGQRAIKLAGLQKQFWEAARPEDQGDRLYDDHGTLLFDRDGAGDDRPEIDRTELRNILLQSLSPALVRWGTRVEAIHQCTDGGSDINAGGVIEHFDVVVGADGAWSRVRPLLTNIVPAYEGVTLVELGFDDRRHPAVSQLVGNGKMFAIGNNRILVGQRNGHGHIRGYVGLRMPEGTAREWATMSAESVRATLVEAFAGWAPQLTDMIRCGDFIGVRALYALPIGHTWEAHQGLTLLGDAAHLMSPFAGEGVNLALADAADLAQALGQGNWKAIAAYETQMMTRARPAAEGSVAGLNTVLSSRGVAPVLDHYRERVAS